MNIFSLLADFIHYRTFDLHKINEAKKKEVRDLMAEHKKIMEAKEKLKGKG